MQLEKTDFFPFWVTFSYFHPSFYITQNNRNIKICQKMVVFIYFYVMNSYMVPIVKLYMQGDQ